MVKDAKPFVTRKTARGRTYYYFERGGLRVRLPGNPDSAEFDEAYWRLRSGATRPQVKTTYDAIITAYYDSPDFRKLKYRTKTEYRRTLELIREKNGPKDFRALRRKHVIAAQSAYSDTPRKANAMVEMLSILSRLAIDLEWIVANPAQGVKKLKLGSYEPWPDAKLAAFERYCRAKGLTTELTTFMLATGTGQRIGDVCKMLWADFDGDFVRVRQEKTGAELWVACPSFVRDYLSGLPRTGRHILAKNLTEQISVSQVQKLVMRVRTAIEARDFVIHGWRYNAAVALAEAGCSDSEIAAVTGHKTLTMVAKYRGRANQKRLSKQAQDRRT